MSKNIFYSSLNEVITALSADETDQDIIQEFQGIQTRLSEYLDSKNSINFDNEKAQKLLMIKDIKDSELSKSLGVFIEKFEGIPKQISELRSNYIPVESISSYYTRFSLGQNNAFGEATKVGDDFALKESYENAFMRILGMPESDDLDDGEDIFIIDPQTLRVKKVKVSTLFSDSPEQKSTKNGLDILDERQRPLSDRLNQFSGHSTDSALEELSKKATTTTTEEVVETGINVDKQGQEQQMVAVTTINLDFNSLLKLFYLKSLPIQDSRFLKCISESSKIVSKPFDDRFVKTVNKEKIKTSFLENLIRLRIDKISGSIHNDSTKKIEFNDKESLNQFSILEQFLFENLLDMLSSMANKYSSSINDIVTNAKKIKQQDDEAKKKIQASSAKNNGDDKKKEPEPTSDNSNLSELQEAVEIQESLLLILKDTSASSAISQLANSTSLSPSLYDGYIRNVSGYDDAISNSIISIIESETAIYRDRLNALSKPALDGNTGDPSGGGVQTAVCNTIVGSETIPVGIVDILVYVLALFSMSEIELINLLNQKQKERLARILSPNGATGWNKKVNIDALFSSEDFNLTSPVDSINKLTVNLSIYYNFFIKSLSDESKDKTIRIVSSSVDETANAVEINANGEADDLKE
jgi:hypothetical protein